jgi:2-dehydro-3-deoxy-D-arabinonate dehydratase
MQLCKIQLGAGEVRVGVVTEAGVQCLRMRQGVTALCDVLYADNPAALVRDLIDDKATPLAVADTTFLPPIDRQEVWAAGVTYKRSQEARERESVGAAKFYDLVYSAARPELFFKANPQRVSGPGQPVHVRRDSKWSVPEPELALVLSPTLKLVGFTIGNDMSARDIEGENPLYLPQAKVYDHCCALGPVITLTEAMPPLAQVKIRLTIERGQETAFEGSTNLGQMKRPPAELIDWLGREATFPTGAILLTGTGIVPPDAFSLAVGDMVHIEITGIGRLTNRVAQRG